MQSTDLPSRLEQVRNRIEAACWRAGRPVESVTLLPVTKGQPPARIQEALEIGLTLFGENKVQEAKAKIGLCPQTLRWHLIGHLQTNKCRDAVHYFDMIQSVDRLDLARELDRWAARTGKSLPILLEVNQAGEATKFGFSPETLLAELEAINALPQLEIHGLMTLAPWTPDPEKVRPVFRALSELKQRCEDRLGVPLPHLSMGMSGDFEVAIEEGATIVRIGTLLFGPRPPAKSKRA